MENLNAEQVKKALEWAISEEFCENCLCTVYGKSMTIFLNEVLAIINSQEQRIGELAEENERLNATKYYIHSDGKIEMIPTVDSVRADTVRKMQERLKADAVTIQDHTGKLGVVVGVGNIDDVAREMLEGVDNE